MENEQLTFEFAKRPAIKGFPELRWRGKHPYDSTQYYPAQLRERYGEETNGWINKIFWGDNLQVMSHLLKKFRGQVNLIYIDPPFDSKADYKKKIKIKGSTVSSDSLAFEEKQYGDIWTNDEYLQFMYERLIIARELLASDGCIYVHCDYRKSHHLRCLLEEVFGAEQFQNEVIWCYRGMAVSTNHQPQILSVAYANIHKALKYAVKMDMLDVNVADKVELPKIQKFEANFYNKDELEQLFEVFKGDRLELVVHIAAYYGLRKSEIIGLKWDSVNFEEKKLTVRRKVSSTYGSGKEMIFVENQLKTESSVRTFPLIPHIEQMLIERKTLEEYYSKLLGKDFDREYDGFVCRDNFGKLITPNFVTSHFKYIIQKNKLKHIRFHDLRHSCASLLLANGVSMKAIQEWLGHSTFNVTANFYSHLDFHSKVESAETIAKVLGGDSTDTEQAIHDKGSEDEKKRKSST